MPDTGTGNEGSNDRLILRLTGSTITQVKEPKQAVHQLLQVPKKNVFLNEGRRAKVLIYVVQSSRSLSIASHS